MKGGSKPRLYEVGAELSKPLRRRRKTPVLAGTQPPEPHWGELFECDSRHLTDTAKQARSIWRAMLPQLLQTGHLAYVDGDLLADYCVCRARILECEREISVAGLVVDGQRGPVRNPAVTIAGQYRNRSKVCEEQLGLGPMNRLRLPPPLPPADNDDDLDEPAE